MLDIESLFIYGSVLVVSCYFSHFYDANDNKFGLIVAYICIAGFCAIRFDVGFDYRGYVEIFEKIQMGYPTYVEPGYYLLNLIFSDFNDGYIYVLGCMSFLTFGFLFSIFSRSKNLTWNIFFLFTFQLLFQLNNQVRQGLAIAIFFYSLYYLENNKYWKYVFIILFGALFHYTIVFLLLLLLLRNFRFPSFIWIVLMLSTFFISLTGTFKFLGNYILTKLPFYTKYLTYGDRINTEEHTNILIVFFWISVGIIIALGHKYIRNKQMLNFYLLGITLYPVFVSYHLIERMLLYLMFLNGLLAAEICRKNKNFANALFFIGLFVFIVYCLKNWGISGGYPYYTIFSNHLMM